MTRQIVIYFDPDSPENKNFFEDVERSKSGVMAAILHQGKSTHRVKFSGARPRVVINDTSQCLPRGVDPKWVAEALGADLIGSLHLIDGVNFQDMTSTLTSGTELEQEEINPMLENSDLVFRNNDSRLYLKSRHVLRVVKEETDEDVIEPEDGEILWERNVVETKTDSPTRSTPPHSQEIF